MDVKESTQESILSAISGIGDGATILEIEKKIPFERHTLSKYLSFMEAHGLVVHKEYGKAKAWFINKAPIQTVLNSLPEKKTFTEKILSDLISVLPCGLMIIDKDYSILFSSLGLKEDYGPPEGRTFYSHVLGHENPLRIKGVSDIIWGKADTARLKVSDKNGKTLCISATKMINPDKSLSIILLIDDVTKVKKAEEQVRAQKAMLEAEREALNKSAIVSETDIQGRITYANDKFCEISKYRREELIGQNHRIINSGYHPKSFFREMWSTISNGKVWNAEIRNKAKDGTFYWVDSAIAPVLGKSGKPVKYLSIRFDITKLKETEGSKRNKL